MRELFVRQEEPHYPPPTALLNRETEASQGPRGQPGGLPGARGPVRGQGA